jgi:8-oxo-dGTP pyrophosphatase MutT (NUDIX family)
MQAAEDLIPTEIKADSRFEALLAAANPYKGGNSRAARSARARAQRRDSKGRFAYMGGAVRIKIELPDGRVISALVYMVGNSDSEDSIEVVITNVDGIDDGVYTVPTQNIQAIKAVLDPEDVDDLPTINRLDPDLETIKLANFIGTKKDAPSGWKLDPTYKKQSDSDPDKRFVSEDGYIVDYYANYSGKKSDPAFKKQSEIEGGAQAVGMGEDGKFAKGEPVYVLKRDASIYKGDGETEVVARVQHWGQVQVAAREDEKKFDDAIEAAPDDLEQAVPAESEGYTGENYLDAVSAKSKKNIANIDKALRAYVADNPQKVGIANMVGDSETPVADLIKSLAEPDADAEALTTKLMQLVFNLPQTENFKPFRDAITAVVDAAIELEDKDLKKAKDKVKAVIPAKSKDEVKAESLKLEKAKTEPTELDKIDADQPVAELPATEPEAAPEVPEGLIANDPDLSIKYGLGLGPYQPMEDKSGLPEGATDVPAEIAKRFKQTDLEESFENAIRNDKNSIRLSIGGNAYNVDLDAVRDALQIKGVDTNAILAKVDKGEGQAPENFGFVTKEQAKDLPAGARVIRTGTEPGNWAPGISAMFEKDEDGKWYIGTGKARREVTLDEVFNGKDGNADFQVVYVSDWHKASSEDSVADLEAMIETYKAEAAAYTGDNNNIKSLYKKRTEWAESMLYFRKSKDEAAKQAAANAEFQKLDWKTFEAGDDANDSFVKESPIGTVLNSKLDYIDENDEYYDEKLLFTKVGPDEWKAEGHPDYNGKTFTSDELIKGQDLMWLNIEEIPDTPTAAARAENPDAPLDLSGFKKVSGPQGSNAGGIYEDENGQQFYVKFPQSKLHGENEVLASALYKAFGIPVADVRWGKLDGQDVTYSPMLPEAKADLKNKLSDGTYLSEIQDGFAVDAWLANWDVAGTGFDNIVTSKGKPVRIDTGGALIFRAQGEPKGEAFDEEASEIDTLVSGKNQYSAAVFGDMTDIDKAASAKRLLNISDEEISKIVSENISDPAQAESLAKKLKARRKNILDRFELSAVIDQPSGIGSIISRTAEGGSTVDFVDGSSPATGFIVAMEPDVPQQDGTLGKREEVYDAEEFFDVEKGPQILRDFALKNAEKLREDGFFLGTWFDKENNKVYLDVSEVAPTQEEALKRAEERGEISVYDIETGEYVYTEKGKETLNGQEGTPAQDSDAETSEGPSTDDGAGAGPVGGDESPTVDELDSTPAAPETPKLEGYTYAQNENGVYYPETELTADDLYALRNGQKVPPQLPFIPKNTDAGDTLYFDANGTKRWGQYGAAGALVRRQKEDGSFEYLVVKRNAKAATDGDVWSVPGGAHDSKEDAANPVKTAARELMEEMGWKIPDGTTAETFKHKVADDWSYDYAVVDVANEVTPKLSKEITETKWVSADELKQMQESGVLHSALDAETLDKVLFLAGTTTEFSPVELTDGKWWKPEFDEDGKQKAFRKAPSSNLKKGDIVTVKGSTGERDVVVTNDPVVEDGKVSFDVLNPANGKTYSYTWDADSESSILSNNESAKQYITEDKAETEEAPVEAPKPASVVSTTEYGSLIVFEYDNGTYNANWGMNKAKITPSVNNTFEVFVDSIEAEKKKKASFADAESAIAWVADLVAEDEGNETNSVTNEAAGEASKGVVVHKGKMLEPATEAQLDAVDKMLKAKKITPERKEQILALLTKDDLSKGEIGVVIGELKGAETLPDEELNPAKPLPEGDQTKISVGDKEITQVQNKGGKFFVDADGSNLGAVMPSQSKSGAWTAITQDGDISTIKMTDYATEEAALDAFGAHHASSGMFAENPFGTVAEEVAPEAETADDLVIDDENNDLTPKDPTDILEPNLIFDEVLKNFDHEVMPNGDLKIAESTHTMKQGDKETYKYEAFVRRTKFERFYVYVIETNMTTGEKRVLKVGRREHHSYKALLKSINKGKGGVLSANPRTFFQKDKKLIQPFKAVASAPETDVTESLVSYINKPNGPKTAAELSTALSEFFGDLTNGNYTVSKDVLDAIATDAGLPASFVDQVLDIMAKNKAKAAASLPDTFFGPGKDVPSAPHVSYDGETIVKKGDTVDWTDPKTGKVYRGYVVNIRYMHDSKKYLYSDQTLAIFPELNKEQGYEATRQRHRVSSNLIVINDPSAPLSEPFFPKSKESVQQEDVTTGETQPFTPQGMTPAQAPKVPAKKKVDDNSESTPLSFEEMYGKTYTEGQIVKDSGELGTVISSWVGPGGFQGVTIQWANGDKMSYTDDDPGFYGLEKMPEGTTIEAAKTPVPQSDAVPEIQVSPNGVAYVEVDGVKHPIYADAASINADAAGAAKGGKKKWSELAAGDLVFNGDKWMHVIASGFGEDGNYRVVVDSFDENGFHTLKVMSITPEKKAFLDLHPAAVVTPDEPKVPGSVKLEDEIDMSAPADSQLVEKFEKLVKDYSITDSEDLESEIAGIVTKQLFGEPLTNGEVTDAIKKIEDAAAKNEIELKAWKKVTAEELQDAIQSLENKLSDSSIADAVSDVATAVDTAVPNVKETEAALGDDNDGYPIKKIEFDNVHTKGGKKALFTLIQKVPSKDVKVGDIIRQGVGKNTRYKQVVETNAGGVRGRIAYRWIFPSDSPYLQYDKYKQIQYEKLYQFNVYKVYRPTENYIAAGYMTTSSGSTTVPNFESKVVDGISIQPTQAAVLSLGVDKQSEASYASFGITGEIDGLPYQYVPSSVSNVSLWKEGFDDIKVKAQNETYVIPGAVVTSIDGNSTGIVVDTDQGSKTLSVTWVHGPEAGKNESGLLGTSVKDTKVWATPESAQSIGVSVNAEKIQAGKDKIAQKIKSIQLGFKSQIEQKKLELADKLAAEKAAKEAAEKLAKETVVGSGAEILEVVPVLGWDESAYPELPSLTEAIDQSKNQTGLKSSFGQDVLVDSDNVEDNVLTVSTIEKDGKPVTKLNFTLTSWTTDDTDAGQGLISSLEANPEVKKMDGLKIAALESQGSDKLMKATGKYVNSDYVGFGYGKTYEITLTDENGKAIGKVRVLRANSDGTTPNFIDVHTSGSQKPLAFHNRVEVVFDDVATPEQVEQALKAAGVKQVRPATTIDTKIMLENKIVSLFGNKPDGSKNFTGEARQEALDKAKNNFGLTPESMKPRVEAGNVHFVMEDKVAEALAKTLNFKNIEHGFNPPAGGSGANLPQYLYEEFFGNGTGAIRSAADRALHGIYFTASSGKSDVNNVGGGHVFVGKNKSTHHGSGREVMFRIDPNKAVGRLGLYGNDYDGWGTLSENQLQILATPSLAEVMLKGEVPYADMINVKLKNNSVRNAVIAYFQSKGISEINGIPLAQFFVV